ncbi:MAG: DEAD/DEAH box helicase family protein, partial [Deltaproteobacteria bacterium]|nr:DEAD/DEAH box helicase family protein [Deltaproteobacteria bacterium]
MTASPHNTDMTLFPDNSEPSTERWYVAIPVPLRKPFAYHVIPTPIAPLPGMRVLVPFGKRRLTGYLLEPVAARTEFPYSLKRVIQILDERPSLPADLLTFLCRCADYYMHPIGEVLRTALPAGIDWVEKKGELKGPRIRDKQTRRVTATEAAAVALLGLKKKAPKRFAVLSAIAEQGPVLLDDLRKQFSDATAQVNALEKNGLIHCDVKTVFADPFQNIEVERDTPPHLNDEQQDAVNAIGTALRERSYQGFLLHGITGSGKTEVYLHAAQKAEELGLGTLVLVPEITLTPQLVGRYRARFGDELAVLHSGLS